MRGTPWKATRRPSALSAYSLICPSIPAARAGTPPATGTA